MSKKKSIALIETGGSHEEIIFPQLLFLKETAFETHVIIREDHFKRFRGYGQNEKYLLLKSDDTIFHKIINLFKILQYLKRHNIHDVIFNTAQGAFIRDLCLILPTGINVTGISHNPQKFGNSFTMKLISSRVKKFFVLNDYILDNLDNTNSAIKFESYYCVFFRHSYVKPGDKSILNVVIPGSFDMKRRDYKFLLTSLSRTVLNPGIRFIFPGRSNSDESRAFFKDISNYLSGEQFIYFDEFLPEERFFRILYEADLILPLITPELPLYELYRKYKITGAFNLSFGLNIPLVMHSSFHSITDFQNSSIFFNDSNLIETLNNVYHNRVLIAQCAGEIEKNPKFSFEYQKKRYLNFLQS